MKLVRTVFLIVSWLVVDVTAVACEVCQKQQPKVLRGIAHGAGPESVWDYIWVYAIAAIAIVALFCTVRWIVRPGEYESEHIKRSILNED